MESVHEILKRGVLTFLDNRGKLFLQLADIVVFHPHHPCRPAYPVLLDDRKQDIFLPHVVALRLEEVIHEVTDLLFMGGGDPLVPGAR